MLFVHLILYFGFLFQFKIRILKYDYGGSFDWSRLVSCQRNNQDVCMYVSVCFNCVHACLWNASPVCILYIHWTKMSERLMKKMKKKKYERNERMRHSLELLFGHKKRSSFVHSTIWSESLQMIFSIKQALCFLWIRLIIFFTHFMNTRNKNHFKTLLFRLKNFLGDISSVLLKESWQTKYATKISRNL